MKRMISVILKMGTQGDAFTKASLAQEERRTRFKYTKKGTIMGS